MLNKILSSEQIKLILYFTCIILWQIIRLAPTWQYFGTITCDGLHGIMKLYIYLASIAVVTC